MAAEVGVLFSRVGTVSSTCTSIASLVKHIPLSGGKVVSAEMSDFRLTIRLKEDIGITSYAVTHVDDCFELSLEGLAGETLVTALKNLASKLFTEQIKRGTILDVKSLSIAGMKLSIVLEKSDFLFKSNVPATVEKESLPEKVMASNNRLLLIDASNLINACYFATAYGKDEKDLMKSSTGVYTNAIKALIDRFISIVRIYAPSHIAIAIDEKRELLMRRTETYPGYKANRDNKEKPQSLTDQITLAYKLFEAMDVPQFKVDRMEADDVIGHFSRKFVAENRGDVIILSNDKDLHQLLDGKVTQVLSGNEEVTREDFLKKYEGITPEQFADFKALCGEVGDNIPGVPGIGEKTAIKLLKEYHSLEGVLANIDQLKGKQKEKIENHSEDAIISKRLAMLYTDLPQLRNVKFDDLVMRINKEGMRSVLEELEIKVGKKSE